MEDFTVRLDDNGDIVDTDGVPDIIYDAECWTQNVNNTILATKGQFIFDLSHGLPHYEILGNMSSKIYSGEVEDIVTEAILQEPRVNVIKSLVPTYKNYQLKVEYSATLTDNNDVESEVFRNEQSI